MPANWLGNRTKFNEKNVEPPPRSGTSPATPGFENIRRDSDPATKKRRIFVNMPLDPAFVNPITKKSVFDFKPNKVRTNKYTLVTFLPKNMFEQFRGIANFYFLALVILQVFDEFKEVDISITATPIIIIVGITAIKVFDLFFLYLIITRIDKIIY